ncbi:PDEase domain-containing protein [Nephila pilipes]|uniref:PDEase domain-containing protein n=1 Tax=Nephila pilipes TaxID=299642 RepID=A0A8X6TI65_NEPPI|nr:PDEase domain-containing protein [Nephila pilipes]
MTELCYFLTTLKANYNDVEYHNYHHALSHAQSMYWILKNTPGVFTELERSRSSLEEPVTEGQRVRISYFQ